MCFFICMFVFNIVLLCVLNLRLFVGCSVILGLFDTIIIFINILD